MPAGWGVSGTSSRIVDGTRFSAEVGRHGMRLAADLVAKLFVLSFISVAPTSRTGVYRRLALAELKRDSEDMVEQTKKLAEKSGVECEVRRALDPRPSQAVVAAAEEEGAYCVVIGSSGTPAIDRLLDRALGGGARKGTPPGPVPRVERLLGNAPGRARARLHRVCPISSRTSSSRTSGSPRQWGIT